MQFAVIRPELRANSVMHRSRRRCGKESNYHSGDSVITDVRWMMEPSTIRDNQMQTTNIAILDWTIVEQPYQVLAKRFLFLLLSLGFPLLSTTHAQTTGSQTVIGEKVEKVDRTEVVILVPNVARYGRFHDSLKVHLQGKHDWIYSITIRTRARFANLTTAKTRHPISPRLAIVTSFLLTLVRLPN